MFHVPFLFYQQVFGLPQLICMCMILGNPSNNSQESKRPETHSGPGVLVDQRRSRSSSRIEGKGSRELQVWMGHKNLCFGLRMIQLGVSFDKFEV